MPKHTKHSFCKARTTESRATGIASINEYLETESGKRHARVMTGNIVQQAARIQISEATGPKRPSAVAGPTGPICGPTRNGSDSPDLFQDITPQIVEAEGTQNIDLCEEIRGTFLEATRCNAATNDKNFQPLLHRCGGSSRLQPVCRPFTIPRLVRISAA